MFRCTSLLTSFLFVFLTAVVAQAESVAGLPLHVQKLDSGAVRVWIGDYISSSASIAIPTEKGIVIIDTTGNPKVDRELRRVIARELGRDDFITLINTHEHADHTGGNSVYTDCTIVGHELVAAGMNKSPEEKQRSLEWLTNRVAELETVIGDADANNPDLPRLNEELILAALDLEFVQADAEPVPPTKTFSDQLVLDYGDINFELYYIGGMHTAGDIAVFVPEHGMLMTGDTMADVWLTDTPGCLASFVVRAGVQRDFPLLLANWNTLLAKGDAIKTLVTGHWNGELSFAGFEARVKYIESLWNGVNSATADGSSLEEMLVGYSLAEMFPTLVGSPGCSARNNFTSITQIWSSINNQTSAAEALYELMDQGSDPSMVQQLVAQSSADTPSHYFIEGEINALGYRFFQGEKFKEAAMMFSVNVELYPESWNAYDSLGEALFAGGNNDEAIAMYKKSLELNPESSSGLEMLERIQGNHSVN